MEKKLGRPPGRRKAAKKWNRSKPSTRKRVKATESWEKRFSSRDGEKAPPLTSIPLLDDSGLPEDVVEVVYTHQDSKTVKKAWNFASKIHGEGPPGLSLYGEINQSGLGKIFAVLKEHCSLDDSSLVLDVGCGAGKVLLFAALAIGVKKVVGVEMSDYRANAARSAIDLVKKKLPDLEDSLDAVEILLSPVERMWNWKDITHVYMYDLGIPRDVYVDILRLWMECETAKWMVSYRKPEYLWSCGFDLQLITLLRVKQKGTGAGSHSAYIYAKR